MDDGVYEFDESQPIREWRMVVGGLWVGRLKRVEGDMITIEREDETTATFHRQGLHGSDEKYVEEACGLG